MVLPSRLPTRQFNGWQMPGYDPQFGARPVKRVIQRTLLNDLSKQILAEEVSKDSRIVVDVKDDKIVFENK